MPSHTDVEATEVVWPRRTGWWPPYRARLAETGIGATSREVIEDDSRYIVEHCVLGAGPAGGVSWPESRQRMGVVMGAVQSGKTASMMGVTSMALDAGVDCVVVLAGTRKSLWLQTLERFVAQVDAGPGRLTRRVLLPNPAVISGEVASGGPSSLYSSNRQAIKRMLAAGRPLVVVAMKNTSHLEHVGRLMREVVAPEVEAAGRPFHMLVIDDEADDSSIDNLVDTPGGELATIDFKQTPRRILDLWESRAMPGVTFNHYMYSTYIAYTATPQANFLQGTESPLAPRDFVVGLRAPGATGTVNKRTASYKVPEGIDGWYTGGDVYYRALASVPLCVPNEDSDEAILDGVRAYLVAAAIRRIRRQDRLSPAEAMGATFEDVNQARAAIPSVTSMLVNPSGVMGDHFEVAGRIYAWAEGRAGERASRDFSLLSDRALGVKGVQLDMEQSPELWVRWLESYAQSSLKVAGLSGGHPRVVPAPEEWSWVAQTILEDILPATKLAVINSDEHADDRPQFEPKEFDGRWSAPANLSTIFVSGNVMSRGLTLEGLLTTVYTRSAANPLADTQMQMQRWFGYRGPYIDLCRVFMREEQIDLFARYHENDELLRTDILHSMANDRPADPMILQGRDFLATGKIGSLRGVSLAPRHRALFTYMNQSPEDNGNRQVVADLLTSPHIVVGEPDHPKGVLLEARYSLRETAALLDRLSYVRHGADALGVLASRWKSAERIIGLDKHAATMPLFRAPIVRHPVVDIHNSPYTIAAYLRFWDSCLNLHVPGLYTTDSRPRRWSTLDVSERRVRTPSFSVGVRFGSGRVVADGVLSEAPVPVWTMTRSLRDRDRIEYAWGSQNGPVRGDDFFDFEARGAVPPETVDRTRQPGSDGLVLFHVIDRGENEPTIAVGCAVPRGGPDWVQAARG